MYLPKTGCSGSRAELSTLTPVGFRKPSSVWRWQSVRHWMSVMARSRQVRWPRSPPISGCYVATLARLSHSRGARLPKGHPATRSGRSRHRWVLAAGLWWTEQLAEARAVHEAIARTGRAAAIPAAMVYSLGNRAAIALDEQDEATADSLARQAIEVMHDAALDDHPWASMAHISYGALLCRRGDAAAATEEIEHGLALGERLQAWQLIVHGSFALAEVR